MDKFCTNCGTAVTLSQQFCTDCGHVLASGGLGQAPAASAEGAGIPARNGSPGARSETAVSPVGVSAKAPPPSGEATGPARAEHTAGGRRYSTIAGSASSWSASVAAGFGSRFCRRSPRRRRRDCRGRAHRKPQQAPSNQARVGQLGRCEPVYAVRRRGRERCGSACPAGRDVPRRYRGVVRRQPQYLLLRPAEDGHLFAAESGQGRRLGRRARNPTGRYPGLRGRIDAGHSAFGHLRHQPWFRERWRYDYPSRRASRYRRPGDAYGAPTVKCYCGNPLTPPLRYSGPVYVSPPWNYFRTDTITIVVKTTVVIDTFTLVDPATGQASLRPRGTDGRVDRPTTPTQPTIPPLMPDWYNRTYQLSCDNIADNPVPVTVRDGQGTAPPNSGYDRWDVHIETTTTGALTGLGSATEAGEGARGRG